MQRFALERALDHKMMVRLLVSPSLTPSMLSSLSTITTDSRDSCWGFFVASPQPVSVRASKHSDADGWRWLQVKMNILSWWWSQSGTTTSPELLCCVDVGRVWTDWRLLCCFFFFFFFFFYVFVIRRFKSEMFSFKSWSCCRAAHDALHVSSKWFSVFAPWEEKVLYTCVCVCVCVLLTFGLLQVRVRILLWLVGRSVGRGLSQRGRGCTWLL